VVSSERRLARLLVSHSERGANTHMPFKVALISTGGTIEKTYDELHGVLHNRLSVLDAILASLELDGLEITRVPLMNKDSLDMNEADHALIADRTLALCADHDGVVIVHGTDRLTVTGERIHARMQATGGCSKAVVLTGAMRPYELRRTDSVQNLTEALCAVQILRPGVYASMHNRVLAFPGVRKDYERMAFVKD
jgi:L-asparaginase